MGTNRLEAFSDGVLAIIITIMVLELKVPHGADLAALWPLLPVFLSYVLSFIYVGIYWNNHHHMLHAAQRVNGAILWANLHLLFWLSLVPFVTGWMGENHFAPAPTALYGVVLLMAAIAYWILQRAIMIEHGNDSRAGSGRRQRPQGQAVAAAVPDRDPGRIRAPVDRRRAVRAGRADVAGARPAHRAGDRQTMTADPVFPETTKLTR